MDNTLWTHNERQKSPVGHSVVWEESPLAAWRRPVPPERGHTDHDGMRLDLLDLQTNRCHYPVEPIADS